MWTFLVLLKILLVAVSVGQSFKVGSQYKYEINSKTLTSLSQVTNQNTGVFIRAELIITPVKEDELICLILKPEIAHIHTTFPGAVNFDIPQISATYKPWNISKEPFVIRLKDRIIDELVVSRELPIWEVNVIRSIASQFQIDTQGRRRIPSVLNFFPKRDGNIAVYKIMEDTVEGECEVLYDMTPVPKYALQNMPYFAPLPELVKQGHVIEIRKIKNFSNCEQRPGYHFGITGLTDWEPTTNRLDTFLTRSSVSRVIVSGSLESCTIQSSMTTNKITLSPTLTDHQNGEITCRVNVTLTSTQPDFQTLQRPKNPQVLKKLVYDFNSPFTSDKEAREKWDKRKKQTIYKRISSYFATDREIPERQDKRKESSTNKTLWSFENVLEQFINKRSIDDRTLILSNEGWYQETPKMTEAPMTPFFSYFIGCSGHSIQHSKKTNVQQAVKELAEQLGQQLLDQTRAYKRNVLEKFSILTSLIRTMNIKQLEQSVQEIYTTEQENVHVNFYARRNAWMTFRDALAQAGTGPALLTIVNLITSHKIKGEEAAQVVSTLPKVARYPTAEYLNTFFELIRNAEVVSQSDLNDSSIYAFTELVRMSQVNPKTAHNRYPVHAFGYFASQDDTTVLNVYIPHFAKNLEKAVAERDTRKIQTFITALGNIAHPKIVQIFKPYLEGKKPMTDFQRTLLVLSLNKLTTVHPRLARSVLYKVYANTGEVYQVRVAAVFTLMKTNPPGSMLQRMAQFTHDDPSYQVRSAVKSAIESAAQSSFHFNNELRKNAESAVNLLVPTLFNNQYSRQNFTDYLIDNLFFGYTKVLEYIGSEDSFVPKSLIYKVLGIQSGFKHIMYQISGMISSVQRVQDLFQDIFVFDEEEEEQRNVLNSDVEDQIFTTDNIFKTLNIERFIQEQVEGNAFFEFGSIQRFFTFDNHTLISLPQIINKVIHILSKGKAYNYQKLFSDFEIYIGLPLATGLPFTYTLKTPTYVGLKGKVKVDIPEIQTSLKRFRFPRTVQLFTDVDITFAKTKQGEMGFVTPFDQQRYVAGYKKQFQINLPVKGNLSLDTTKNIIKTEIKFDDKSKDYKFVHYSTKPFTAIQNVVDFTPILNSGDSKIMTSVPIKDITKHYDVKNLGIVFRLRASKETPFISLRKIIYNLIQHFDIISIADFPTAQSIVDDTELGLYYDNKMSTARNLSLNASYRYTRTKEYLQDGNGTEKHFTPKQESQSRIEDFYKQVSPKIKQAVVSVIDLELKVEGKTPIQYVGTFAIACSPIKAPTQVLAYVHQTVGDENFEICFYEERENNYLPALDYEIVLQTKPKSTVTAKLEFGEKCETGVKVNLSGKIERSQERSEYLLTLPQVEQCKSEIQSGRKFTPECKNASVAAAIMDKYRLTIEYNNVSDDVNNMIYQAFHVLRYIGYPYVTESECASKESKSNRIDLDVSLSIDIKTANALLTTPTGTAHFRNIPVGEFVREVLAVHSIGNVFKRSGWSYLQLQSNAYCSIDEIQATTFNNQTYPLHLGNVWHVMSISIPRVNSTRFNYFSVLVRHTSSNHKDVQLSFGYSNSTHVRIIPNERNRPNLFVNEKQIHFDDTGYYEHHDHSSYAVFQAYLLPAEELKIVHTKYGFEFIYDRDSVQLILSEKYRNRIRGLCGVFDGERFDYVTPRGYILRNPEEFAATWALSNEGHINDLKKKAREHSILKKSTVFTNVVSEQDTGKADTLGRYHDEFGQDYDPYGFGSEESSGQDSECTTKRTMVIERDGKHCFSVNLQPACKTGCQVEKTRTMNAEFICMNKSQTSSHWAHMVARGAQPNFKKKGNAQKMQFEGPEVCSKALVV